MVIERHAALCRLLVNDVDESDSSIVLVIFVPWDSDVQDALYCAEDIFDLLVCGSPMDLLQEQSDFWLSSDFLRWLRLAYLGYFSHECVLTFLQRFLVSK